MKLLIDLGNTRLKWASWHSSRLQPGGVFAHAELSLVTELRREWAELVHVDAVLVASVLAPAREQELNQFVRERFSLQAEFVRSPASALGLRNAYAEPARLGADRFLALAALNAQHACAQLLVSVGTALTVDAIAADGVHLGGLILPAPQRMREAVLASTARVGSAQGHYRELPDNTADAVVSGSLYAALGAIERFRINAARQLGAEPVVHLTGGGADELAPLLPDAVRAHDLVLRGLALWAERGRDR